MSTVDPKGDDEIVELPPLLDDGSMGVDDQGDALVADVADSVGLDDAAFEDDDEDLAPLDEEGSWVGDEDEGIELGENEESTLPEEGWLDEQPAFDLDLGTVGENDAPTVVGTDAGQEGLDEPTTPRGRDTDEVDLPPLDRSEDEDATELDIGIAPPAEP